MVLEQSLSVFQFCSGLSRLVPTVVFILTDPRGREDGKKNRRCLVNNGSDAVGLDVVERNNGPRQDKTTLNRLAVRVDQG